MRKDEFSLVDKVIEKEVDSVLKEIKAEIAIYEADCNLSCSEDNCRTCNKITFGSIYRIIDKYKGDKK